MSAVTYESVNPNLQNPSYIETLRKKINHICVTQRICALFTTLATASAAIGIPALTGTILFISLVEGCVFIAAGVVVGIVALSVLYYCTKAKKRYQKEQEEIERGIERQRAEKQRQLDRQKIEEQQRIDEEREEERQKTLQQEKFFQILSTNHGVLGASQFAYFRKHGTACLSLDLSRIETEKGAGGKKKPIVLGTSLQDYFQWKKRQIEAVEGKERQHWEMHLLLLESHFTEAEDTLASFNTIFTINIKLKESVRACLDEDAIKAVCYESQDDVRAPFEKDLEEDTEKSTKRVLDVIKKVLRLGGEVVWTPKQIKSLLIYCPNLQELNCGNVVHSRFLPHPIPSEKITNEADLSRWDKTFPGLLGPPIPSEVAT